MCIFCKIANKEIPADIIYEDDLIMAFKDVHPIAPVHVLIIPKKHIESINDITDQDEQMIGHMFTVAKKIAKDLQTAEKGYKLLFRVGEWGGQEVQHIHLHLIGGAKLYEEIRPI
ncbi:MAG TPA: histidine triad nucleotide-binding protein [Candidatus Moranbacteria bacterium]|nr:histidine triad nucleotide-binding protein [Candidatus Moranbacteria bacterium]